MALKTKILVFWVVALCSVVIGYGRFGGSEDEGSAVLRNVGIKPPHYTMQHPRKSRIEDFISFQTAGQVPFTTVFKN
jgi:hypothetical protein